MPSDPVSNLIMIWETKETLNQSMEESKASYFIKALENQFCRKTLQIVFPDVLDDIIYAERNRSWEI